MGVVAMVVVLLLLLLVFFFFFFFFFFFKMFLLLLWVLRLCGFVLFFCGLFCVVAFCWSRSWLVCAAACALLGPGRSLTCSLTVTVWKKPKGSRHNQKTRK